MALQSINTTHKCEGTPLDWLHTHAMQLCPFCALVCYGAINFDRAMWCAAKEKNTANVFSCPLWCNGSSGLP